MVIMAITIHSNKTFMNGSYSRGRHPHSEHLLCFWCCNWLELYHIHVIHMHLCHHWAITKSYRMCWWYSLLILTLHIFNEIWNWFLIQYAYVDFFMMRWRCWAMLCYAMLVEWKKWSSMLCLMIGFRINSFWDLKSFFNWSQDVLHH